MYSPVFFQRWKITSNADAPAAWLPEEEETELNDAWNVPILFMTHVEGEG